MQSASISAVLPEPTGPPTPTRRGPLERLRSEDPERARVVLLKFFGGLTNQEVADSMGVTERTIERHWAYAKAWLFQSIREQQ